MKHIPLNQQTKLSSDICGQLLEVVNRNDFPFGIVLLENIQTTDPHYHKKSQKCYWMLEGWVKVIVEHIHSGDSHQLTLDTGDLLTIEPYEKHQIIAGSKDNQMVVVTSPPWSAEDVIID